MQNFGLERDGNLFVRRYLGVDRRIILKYRPVFKI
jgi:hypothetical protein